MKGADGWMPFWPCRMKEKKNMGSQQMDTEEHERTVNEANTG